MLVVMAIIAILASLSSMALSSLKGASDLTSSAYTIASTLQRGRAYAMAHNTYVWVGFYEENADATAPTNVAPPYAGVGRVVIGMVASVDGTNVVDNMAAGLIPSTSLIQIEKPIRLQNINLNDQNLPTVGNSPLQLAEATKASPSSTIASNETDATSYPVAVGSYTFYKTVRFSPTGEGVINDSATLSPINEIDLRPTHGTQLDKNSPNVVAIRFTGIGGNVHVYRN